MLSIILTGHGGFASGMEMQAMKQILGEQSQFIAIDFPETGAAFWSGALCLPRDSLQSKVGQLREEAIAQLDCEDGIVFLTDLLGGTPLESLSDSTLAMQKQWVLDEVITGTNLQLLLEMVLEREGLSGIEEFAGCTCTGAKPGWKSVGTGAGVWTPRADQSGGRVRPLP